MSYLNPLPRDSCYIFTYLSIVFLSYETDHSLELCVESALYRLIEQMDAWIWKTHSHNSSFSEHEQYNDMLGKNSMQLEQRTSPSGCDTEHFLETTASNPGLGNANCEINVQLD